MKIDKLALQFFDNPEQFGKAMALLYESAQTLEQYPYFPDYEMHFLTGVISDEYPEFLFDKAENFNGKIIEEFKKLEEEVKFLKQTLTNITSNQTTEDQKQIIAKIEETINPTLPDDENPEMKTLFDEWIEKKETEMVKSSFVEYQRMIGLFIRIITDYNGGQVHINDLNTKDIRHYRNILAKIPSRIVTNKYSIDELVKLHGKPKSPKTIKNTYSNVGTFLKWIASAGYPIDRGLHEVLTYFRKIKDKEKKQRVVLSNDDLKKLFNSEKYTKTGQFYTTAMYWVDLIALFTGARMSEILQLEKHDIVKDKKSKLWVIRIDDIDHLTEDKEKRVKSQDGSRREIPIHNILKELGFLDYVKFIDGRLFPDEPRNDIGKFDAFEKRWRTYRKQISVIPKHEMELRDFHSFRHTLRTRLSEIRRTGSASQQFDEGLIDAIVGHASKDRSIGQKMYTHSQFIEAKSKALNRLQYDSIDFDIIKRWRDCDPWRKEFRKK